MEWLCDEPKFINVQIFGYGAVFYVILLIITLLWNENCLVISLGTKSIGCGLFECLWWSLSRYYPESRLEHWCSLFFLWCLKTFQILWFQHDFIVASGDVHVQLLAEWKHDLIVTINTFKLRCIRQKNSSFEWPHWLSHKHPITSGWYYGWLNEEIWLKIFFDSVMAWITTTQKCLEMPVKFPSEFD